MMDCREGLRRLPEKSVDLIVTDPPYNIKKEKAWDSWRTVSAYVEFMGEVFTECERVLKDNGSLYFFHNDFPQIAALQSWIEQNTRFVHNSFIIWDKGENWRAMGWKNPSESNTLRSWFTTCEYALCYTFQDESGLTTVKHDPSNFSTLRDYFRRLQEATGLTKKAIMDRVGQRADHAFRWSSTQWDLPTSETYAELVRLVPPTFDVRSYESLKAEYDEYRRQYEGLVAGYESKRFVHHLDANHNNVWRVPTENRGKYHTCQKPLSIIERMIRTSSNEGGLVLDPFMGSGTTALAARNLGRRFVGFESDPRYFEVANRRLLESA